MFGHKKDTTQAEPLEVKVQSMPKDFYGGANPVVTFRDVKKNVNISGEAPSSLSKAEKVAYGQTTTVGRGSPLHIVNLLMNGKFIVLGGLGLFALFAGGAGVYYWYQSNVGTVNNAPTPPAILTVQTPEITPAPILETTTTPSEIVTGTVPVVSSNSLLEFPSMGLVDSVDLDNDGLSDTAEEIFQTDPALPDTDEDSYSDTHEIFYLYNPAGKEPMRLIEAGTMQEYINPVFNYSLYYPLKWAVGNTKDDYRDILFSTLSGDNIEVLTVDKDINQDFVTWFLQNVPGEQFSNYGSFESRFGAIGYERSDKLVYFIVTPERIYILAYHTSETKIVNYRIVLNMIARSFKLPGASGNMASLEEMISQSATTTVVTSTSAVTSTY